MIFAESAGNNSRVPAAVASVGIKTLGIIGLAYWLLQILPLGDLSGWSWIVITASLLLALAFFYRRLIFWHSEWQHSLETTLNAPNVNAGSARPAPSWTKRSTDWQLNVHELDVPERAAYAGQTIAALALRSRFGCTIAEINRQGHVITAPSPHEKLFPGDRLLLLGTDEQSHGAREELSRTSSPQGLEFQDALLETIEVADGPRTGATLAQLQIPVTTGILLVGIDRDKHRIPNPSGAERILAGDRLLILGTPRKIARFRDWLNGVEDPPADKDPNG